MDNKKIHEMPHVSGMRLLWRCGMWNSKPLKEIKLRRKKLISRKGESV
jgi:hypothetical protein